MSEPTHLAAHSHERLQELEGDGALFTSDLSVNEFLLVKESGFEPLGLVVGTSIYHVGFQQASWSQNQEMTVLTQAMYHARELAMERLEAEAAELGADGVVGVRLKVGWVPWAEDLAEFVAIGTAVKHRAQPGSFKAPNGKPFTSDLSGQDFWTLLQAGYRPVGLVVGNCVYHIAHQSFRQAWRNIGQNVEMENFTQALYDARELAMERMQHEAKQLKAQGVVGVDVREASYGWSSHVIEFAAVGTAVVAMRADHHIPTPQLVLTVND